MYHAQNPRCKAIRRAPRRAILAAQAELGQRARAPERRWVRQHTIEPLESPSRKAAMKSPPCPCGGAAYATCCGPFISGAALPPTAEKLMRSRYTAFTRRDESYLRATWHPSTRPSDAILSDKEILHWLGLEVESALRIRQPGAGQSRDRVEDRVEDSVEFVARYKINGRAHRLHEVSRFVREHDAAGARWYYLDGSFPAT
jgi:SEC-C motif domain protein